MDKFNKLTAWKIHPTLTNKNICKYKVVKELLPPDKRRGDLLTIFLEENKIAPRCFGFVFQKKNIITNELVGISLGCWSGNPDL